MLPKRAVLGATLAQPWRSPGAALAVFPNRVHLAARLQPGPFVWQPHRGGSITSAPASHKAFLRWRTPQMPLTNMAPTSSHYQRMSDQVAQSIVYKRVGELELHLDVIYPRGARDLPVVLWLHIGGLVQGHRETAAPHQLRNASRLGYALVTADYRLAPQVGMDDIMQDVTDCITFIRTSMISHIKPGILDTTRLAVTGSSAGGFLALLAGLYVEPKPQAVIAIYPVTDPLSSFYTNPQPHPSGEGPVARDLVAEYLDPQAPAIANNHSESPRQQLYFYVIQEALLPELLRLQPGDDTYRICKNLHTRSMPPTYVVHGDADQSVPVTHSDEVAGAMFGLGLEVVYDRLVGADHTFDLDDDVELPRLYAFLKKHLRT